MLCLPGRSSVPSAEEASLLCFPIFCSSQDSALGPRRANPTHRYFPIGVVHCISYRRVGVSLHLPIQETVVLSRLIAAPDTLQNFLKCCSTTSTCSLFERMTALSSAQASSLFPPALLAFLVSACHLEQPCIAISAKEQRVLAKEGIIV